MKNSTTLILILALSIQMSAQTQSEDFQAHKSITAHVITGGNIVNFGEQIEQGVNFQIGARKLFNREQGTALASSVGFQTGYFSYYRQGVHRANTVGVSFGVSAEHLLQVVGTLDYFWQARQLVPSLSLEAQIVQFGRIRFVGALQMGVLPQISTWYFSPRFGAEYLLFR